MEGLLRLSVLCSKIMLGEQFLSRLGVDELLVRRLLVRQILVRQLLNGRELRESGDLTPHVSGTLGLIEAALDDDGPTWMPTHGDTES